MKQSYFKERNKCPGCHSESYKEIYESSYTETPIKDYLIDFYDPQGGVEFEYLEGEKYSLGECSFCGMIFQKFIPGDELMKRLYEVWIDPELARMDENRSHDFDFYSDYALELLQILSHFKNNPDEIEVFDFGMGWSKWLFMARAFGCVPYGSELSKERIDYAKSNGINVLSWDQIPDYSFDFINTEQVFEHISDPLETLQYLKQSLKPGGFLKVSVPPSGDIDARLRIMNWQAKKGTRKSLNAVAPLEHINCFKRDSIIEMGKIAGLKEVHFSLKSQYKYYFGWALNKKSIIKMLRPIFRNVLKRENYVLFSNQ
ncbi:MAG: class I SAM-dependent methyltransferase [Balneolaceae bacterium]|nr:MAG: class I SAM-dependent methyltransferase [Balneolaceae bacterium]